jgi:hypothetical protein
MVNATFIDSFMALPFGTKDVPSMQSPSEES